MNQSSDARRLLHNSSSIVPYVPPTRHFLKSLVHFQSSTFKKYETLLSCLFDRES